ncbi:MAG: cofactor-independent phosphoglycerate mutase [Muribaculaceae bacterium]
MKHIIILGDGMADEPVAELGGLTPLQAAHKPTIDSLCRQGRCGMLHTVPQGYHPGSEVAHLSLLGYDLDEVFEGRGSLEAASMGVEIEPGEMAMRCNLICVEDGKIKNHSAGHISDEEAAQLIDFLNEKLASDRVRFFNGVSYRHLLKIKGGDKHIECTPPHDVPGTPFAQVLVRAGNSAAQPTAQLINELIIKSQEILPQHSLNKARAAQGKDMANSIWPWSPGYRPSMTPMAQLYGIGRGAVISAVDLIRGIGIYAGLQPIIVPGATGLYDTNYEGKAQAAIDAISGDYDFVFLHVEASDEAGHEGDYKLKCRTVEYLDSRICKPIVDAVSKLPFPVAISVLPDHPTPCAVRTHTANPVPFLICRPGDEPDAVSCYDEISAQNGVYGMMTGDEYIREFLRK